jgi:hypothetical protein
MAPKTVRTEIKPATKQPRVRWVLSTDNEFPVARYGRAHHKLHRLQLEKLQSMGLCYGIEHWKYCQNQDFQD